MANNYYTRQNDYLNGSIARGDSVQGDLQAVEQGFDKLPNPLSSGQGFSGPVVVGAGVSDNHALRRSQVQDLIDLAGGFSGVTSRKNKLINGGFDIWQRGTSFTGGVYSADRWVFAQSTSDSIAFSRQEFTPGQIEVPGNPGYFMRIDVAAGGSAGLNDFRQRVEGVGTFAGQTVTLSFYMKASSSSSVRPRFGQNFGSGGSSVVNSSAGSVAITTAWARYAFTDTLASISGKTVGSGSYLDVVLTLPANETRTYDIACVQLELGEIATDFENRFLAEEEMLSRRYYRNSIGKGMPASINSTTSALIGIAWDQPMRTKPSLSIPGSLVISQQGLPNQTAASPTLIAPTLTPLGMLFSVTGFTGLTSGVAGIVGNDAFVLDAEL